MKLIKHMTLSAALITLIAFSFISEAKAENRFAGQKRIVVDTVSIVNPWLSLKVDKRLTRDAVNFIRSHGIRYSVGKFKEVDDPFETFHGGRLYPEQFGPNKADAFAAEFTYWLNKDGGYVPDNHIELVSAPPWLFDGVGEWKDGFVPYYAGRAEVGRARNGCIAYASAAEYTVGGASRYRHSLITRIHELLHCGNAEHLDTEVNIMHPAAAHFIFGNNNIPLLPETVKQVKGYLKK